VFVCSADNALDMIPFRPTVNSATCLFPAKETARFVPSQMPCSPGFFESVEWLFRFADTAEFAAQGSSCHAFSRGDFDLKRDNKRKNAWIASGPSLAL